MRRPQLILFFKVLLLTFLVNNLAHAAFLIDSSSWRNKKLTKKFEPKESGSQNSTRPNDFFSDGLTLRNVPNDDSIRKIIDKATLVFSYVDSAKSYIDELNDAVGFEPVAIQKAINGLDYPIAIHAIRMKAAYSEIDVLMQFEIPQNGKKLTFMANDIKFSREGGIIGDARLQLVGDYAINFNGNKGQLILKGNIGGTGHTFVRMDCDGFREMTLDAEVRFSRDLLIPEDSNGNAKEGNVVATFQSTISDWNDLLVQLSLPDFQVSGLNGFGFKIKDAVFDFSDTRNANGIIFPKGYSVEADLAVVNLWRGVYIHQLAVSLPAQFKNKQATRTTLAATDLLIDHQGLSGLFEGKQLIPLDNGDISGWAFSLDSLAVSLIANQIKQAGFKGDIVVPIGDARSPFHYEASLGTNNQYLFDIKPTKDLQFNIFQTSKVEINKGSSLEIKIENGRFLPKAILSGKMDINAKLSETGQGVSLADIRFENLQIQSVQPYITAGRFSFGSETVKQMLAGFPVTITEVSFSNTAEQANLNFDVKLNLVGESAGAFAADAGLTIVGQLSTSNTQHWDFKELQVKNADIDIDEGPAFKFGGNLAFYKEDPVYGDGFKGAIEATFLSKLTVNASAIFGNQKGERYWYVDALTKFTPGITFFPGVGFYGFGGGAFYRMKMGAPHSSTVGKTASGVSYIPALENDLGLKAIVYLGSMPSERAFSADLTFEMTFFKNGGIHSMSMTGNAFIATAGGLEASIDNLKSTVGNMSANLTKLEQALNSRNNSLISRIGSAEIANVKSIQGDIGSAAGDKGGISAHVYISYDFENSMLHGNFDTQINISKGVIKGGGDAVLHFAPQEWYVYVGTPEQRFTISLGIGPLRANSSSYFMVGTKIPGSPPPPQAVSQILGGKDLDYMKDLNAIGSGAGFAFGASLSVKTGDITFLVFYANFSAGAGFDIMVKNYGNTFCEGSDSRLGINGWYANGQAYAYFTGDIGVKVHLFWSTKQIKILSIGAAAILQAKLPNPFWMQGSVGGYFSVLGGLVSGRCSFEVTLGTECTLVTKGSDDELNNIAVISQLTPGIGETEVNVFNNPQGVFNLPIDKEFDLEDDNTHQKYRIKLDYFNLTTDGASIPGNIQWNASHTVVAFSNADILPPKKQIKSSVQVSFQKLVNNSWQPVLQNSKPVVEKKEVTFTTGEAPDYIPLSNVEYSYPVIGQLNFYKNESVTGYIKLRKGQPYLFDPRVEWVQKGQFKDSNGNKTRFDFVYSTPSSLINFTIPSDLKSGQVYDLELVNIPKFQNGMIDRNVNSASSRANISNLNAEIKTQQAQGAIIQLQEKKFFSGFLRSSKYSTLSEKVAAQKLSSVLRGLRILWRVDFLKAPFDIDEPFDKAELYGTSFTGFKPLISFVADLTHNAYFDEQVNPIIYDGYPLDGNIVIKNRTPSLLGVPPFRAVSVIQNDEQLELSQNDPQYTQTQTVQYYFYDLLNYMYYDFLDIQQQIAQRYLSMRTSSPRIDKILWSQFPMLLKGDYKININYPYLTSKKQIHQKK